METSTKPKFSNGGVDRISYLPDDILHNILSCLYIFDVVQLSVLSKKWYYLCRTMPFLEFDIIGFCSERIRRHVVIGSALAKKFENFINWVLISQRSTNLVRFKLCSSNLFDNMAIFRWICAATARDVQELVLSFGLNEPFELPVCASTCESLRVLKLDLSEAILKLPSYMGFCQLKFLHLANAVLSNEHLTSCLFSKSPLLEKLILGGCSPGTMTMLDISSTSLLYLYLIDGSNSEESYSSCTIKISCPNLKLLKYCAPMPKDIVMENLFSIEVLHIFLSDTHYIFEEIGMLVLKMINSVPSTTKLKLCIISILGLHRVVGHEVRNSLFTFNKLKSLKLVVGIDDGCMQGMILLLKHSPNLEFLQLLSDENYGWDENWKLYDPKETIVCLESHLKVIRLTDFKYEENEMELLRFFLKNAPVLEKMTIVWANYAEKYEEASEVVLEYPRASSQVIVTFDYNRNQRYANNYYQV